MTYTTRATCPHCARPLVLRWFARTRTTPATHTPVYYPCSRCNPPKQGDGAYGGTRI